MSKLLATDLDGTLFYPKNISRCIPKKNVKFLRKFIDEGNKVVVVSSRSSFFTKKLSVEIDRPIDFLNCSSAEIISDGKVIRSKTIPNNVLKKILDEIDEKFKPAAFLLTSKKYPIIIKDLHRKSTFFKCFYGLYEWFQFSYREDYLLNNDIFDEEVANGEIYKVMIFYGLRRKNGEISKEINKIIRSDYPEIESSWSSILNELTPKDCSKGEGLEYYCNAKGIDPKDVYVVGDSGNDISMFNSFHENSFAMKHSSQSVQKYANHVVSRVYKIADYVLKGEK
ncbi:MAG: HAD-IIB family hydrolase [Bacilli bacterium]